MKNADHNIQICLGSSCFSRGNEDSLEHIKKYLKENKKKGCTDFRGHLCIKQCKCGPNLTIDGNLYNYVSPEGVSTILDKHFQISAENANPIHENEP